MLSCRNPCAVWIERRIGLHDALFELLDLGFQGLVFRLESGKTFELLLRFRSIPCFHRTVFRAVGVEVAPVAQGMKSLVVFHIIQRHGSLPDGLDAIPD